MNTTLLNSILSFLDPHVAICLLENANEQSRLDKSLYNRLMLNLLLRTKKYSRTRDFLNNLKADIPDATFNSLNERLTQRESELTTQLESLKVSVDEMKAEIIRVFESEEKFMKEQKNKQNTGSRFIAIPKKITDDTLQYAFLLYESGDYENARYYVNQLFCVADHLQDLLKLHWGRFFLLLIKRFEDMKQDNVKPDNTIMDELKSLRSRLESRGPESYFQVVSGKCSLLHYIIMISYVFAGEPDYDYLIDIFATDSYMSAIQTCSPHLFRYLVFMLILSKNKKKTAKYNLSNVVSSYENNLCTYEDEAVKFVNQLYVKFNFEQANEELKQFGNCVANDILLAGHEDDIVNNSKELLFEAFCNIYSSVDIDLISKYLGLSKEESEIWIVNLIRKNNIKARFSSDNKSTLELKNMHKNVYEETVKRSRDL